jgi:hypothetical protein
MPHQLADGAGAKDGIRIQRDQDIVAGVRDGVVQRGGFAAVGLREDANVGAIAEVPPQDFQRGVLEPSSTTTSSRSS